MSIQSIIFDKDFFTERQADRWIRRNGFTKTFQGKKGAHSTLHTWRYRQRLPDKNKRYVTKKIADGIKIILQY